MEFKLRRSEKKDVMFFFLKIDRSCFFWGGKQGDLTSCVELNGCVSVAVAVCFPENRCCPAAKTAEIFLKFAKI